MSEKTVMRVIVFFVLMSLIVAPAAWAQLDAAESPPAASPAGQDQAEPMATEQSEPPVQPVIAPAPAVAEQIVEGYIGVCTADRVYVRSGPAQVYYPVTFLKKDDQVIVRKELFNTWAQIEPTTQCFSYIAKEFVKLSQPLPISTSAPAATTETPIPGETGTDVSMASDEPLLTEPIPGTVIGDNVRVRAGSMGSVRPANADEVQVRLNDGATVLVLGEREDYYKIVPPENSYYFVSLPLIDRVGKLTQADLIQNRMALRRETGSMAAAALEQVTAQASAQTGGATPDITIYRAIERLYREELKKPLAERNFDPILKRLELLTQNATDSDVTVAAKMLEAQVNQAVQAFQAWQKSRQQDENLQEVLAQIRQRIEYLSAADELTKGQDNIVVRGRLAESAVFSASSPLKRYLVLDGSEKIQCYAVSGNDQTDLARYVGKEVTMLGTVRFDAFSGTRMLTVAHVVEVTPTAPAAQ